MYGLDIDIMTSYKCKETHKCKENSSFLFIDYAKEVLAIVYSFCKKMFRFLTRSDAFSQQSFTYRSFHCGVHL